MPEKTEGYCGWKNYETWAVSLWIGNEEASYLHWSLEARRAMRRAAKCRQVRQGVWTAEEAKVFLLADRLKKDFTDGSPLADVCSVYADLLNAALSEVDWNKIARHLLDENTPDVETVSTSQK